MLLKQRDQSAGKRKNAAGHDQQTYGRQLDRLSQFREKNNKVLTNFHNIQFPRQGATKVVEKKTASQRAYHTLKDDLVQIKVYR